MVITCVNLWTVLCIHRFAQSCLSRACWMFSSWATWWWSGLIIAVLLMETQETVFPPPPYQPLSFSAPTSVKDGHWSSNYPTNLISCQLVEVELALGVQNLYLSPFLLHPPLSLLPLRMLSQGAFSCLRFLDVVVEGFLLTTAAEQNWHVRIFVMIHSSRQGFRASPTARSCFSFVIAV